MAGRGTLSDELPDNTWLIELESLGRARGRFVPLGDDHCAVFVDQSPSVLFVGFEARIPAHPDAPLELPLGFGLPETRGWSHLSVIASCPSWFRSEPVFEYFDGLADEGLLDEFDRVIFYGAGMCGYAAAAFSVAAPGSTVIAVAPQATLDPRLTEWDERYSHMRRTEFASRYGFAPDMLDAAERAFVIYDPYETFDAMHATLFARPNVTRLRYRRGSADAIDADLHMTDMFDKLLDAAADGRLDRPVAARILRRRHDHLPYLRALLDRIDIEDRPEMAARLCRAVLRHHDSPRFRRALHQASEILGAEDIGVMPISAAPHV